MAGEHRMEMASLGFLEKFMSTFDLRKHLETEVLQELFTDWKGTAQLYNALKTGKFCSVFGTLKILYFQLRGSTRCFLLVTIFDSLLIFLL